MKKWENVTFFKGNEPIQSHLLGKVGALHIFFIILMNPAKEYLYTRKIRKKN